jgi:hypothetical protein
MVERQILPWQTKRIFGTLTIPFTTKVLADNGNCLSALYTQAGMAPEGAMTSIAPQPNGL